MSMYRLNAERKKKKIILKHRPSARYIWTRYAFNRVGHLTPSPRPDRWSKALHIGAVAVDRSPIRSI